MRAFEYDTIVGKNTYESLKRISTEFGEKIKQPPSSDVNAGPVEEQIQEICKNITLANETLLEIIRNSLDFVSKTDENFERLNEISVD